MATPVARSTLEQLSAKDATSASRSSISTVPAVGLAVRECGSVVGTPNVSVIIPTLNERENVKPLLERIRKALAEVDFEVLVVDDASVDGTGPAVTAEARHHSNIRLLQRSGKLGLSSAVLDGVAGSVGSIVVMMDADLSHDPAVLPQLITRVQSGEDVAIGSRYVTGGRLQGWPLHRRIGSLFLTWSVRALFRLRVRDPLTGYAAFRRHVLESMPTHFSARGFKLLLEVLATQPTLRVSEVPITFADRTRGTSKLDVGELREFTRLCYRLLRWRMHPQPAGHQKSAW